MLLQKRSTLWSIHFCICYTHTHAQIETHTHTHTGVQAHTCTHTMENSSMRCCQRSVPPFNLKNSLSTTWTESIKLLGKNTYTRKKTPAYTHKHAHTQAIYMMNVNFIDFTLERQIMETAAKHQIKSRSCLFSCSLRTKPRNSCTCRQLSFRFSQSYNICGSFY